MEWLTQPVSLVLVALITGIGSWLGVLASRRSADRSVAGQIETSRMQAETNAFERAKAFYETVIERQEEELDELRTEVKALRAKTLEQDLLIEDCYAKCRMLVRRLGDPDFHEPKELP